MSDWSSLLGGAVIVAALFAALLSTLLAAKWATQGRGQDGDDRR